MDIHEIIRNLKSVKDAEENLKAFSDFYFSHAAGKSKIDFAFSLVSILGLLVKEELRIPENVSESLNSFIKMTDEYISGKKDADISGLRDQVISLTEKYTGIGDLFHTEEYVLNRVEYRFREEKLPAGYSDLDEASLLVRFIGSHERGTQGVYISEIIPELPIRLTKNRFYELIAERLSVYAESDEQALLNAVKMLRSAMGLNFDTVFGPEYKKFTDLYGRMRAYRCQDITESDYLSFLAEKNDQSLILNDTIDVLTELETGINAFYAFLLSDSKSFGNVSERAEIVMKEALKGLLGEKDKEECIAACYELCNGLENEVEAHFDALNDITAFVGSLKDGRYLPKYDLSELIGRIEKYELLTGESLFAGLEKIESRDVTEELLRSETDRLIDDIAKNFAGMDRMFVRAVMSRAFTVLPPHFGTAEELETYIYQSLSSCSNAEEKLGCLDILNQITEE